MCVCIYIYPGIYIYRYITYIYMFYYIHTYIYIIRNSSALIGGLWLFIGKTMAAQRIVKTIMSQKCVST